MKRSTAKSEMEVDETSKTKPLEDVEKFVPTSLPQCRRSRHCDPGVSNDDQMFAVDARKELDGKQDQRPP
jgi:hypothetical protein